MTGRVTAPRAAELGLCHSLSQAHRPTKRGTASTERFLRSIPPDPAREKSRILFIKMNRLMVGLGMVAVWETYSLPRLSLGSIVAYSYASYVSLQRSFLH